MVRPGRERLAGHVEVDEAYLGGVEGGVFGRQTDTKAIVAIAVEVKHPKGFGRIRLQRVDDVSKDSLIPVHRERGRAWSDSSTLDGWQAYWTVPEHGYEHERTIHSAPSPILPTPSGRCQASIASPALAQDAGFWLAPHQGCSRTTSTLDVQYAQRVHVPLQPTPDSRQTRPALLSTAARPQRNPRPTHHRTYRSLIVQPSQLRTVQQAIARPDPLPRSPAYEPGRPCRCGTSQLPDSNRYPPSRESGHRITAPPVGGEAATLGPALDGRRRPRAAT